MPCSQAARLSYKILSEHTHTRTNLQYKNVGTGINGISNALCNIQVCKEMLS